MLSRFWSLITFAWFAICLYNFAETGELRHMSAENALILLTPTLIRVAVVFVLFGFPRRVIWRRPPLR